MGDLMKKRYELGGMVFATKGELLALVGLIVAMIVSALLGFGIFVFWVAALAGMLK